MNKFTVQPLLTATYKEVYQRDPEITINDLLQTSKKDDIIALCTFIISKYNSPDFFNWEFDTVNNIITHLPAEESKFMTKRFNELTKKNKQYPRVFNIINCLKLIQYALLNLTNDSSRRHKAPDSTVLDVFLLLNSDIADPTNELVDKYKDLTYKERYIRTMSAATIVNSEFLTSKDAVVQSIKLQMLFRFLESHPDFKKLIPIFLSNNKVNDWKEYLKFIMILYMSFHDDNGQFVERQVSFKIPLKNYDPLMQDFINSLSINNHIHDLKKSNEIRKKDFYYLRNFPFYIGDDDFLYLFNVNFLIDRIFQSVYFDFRDILAKNFSPLEAENFKSKYSTEFSQNELFAKTIEYCFNDNRFIKRPGDTSGNAKDHSDYYIRKDKIIYLIEFKDYLLSMDLKYSMDYEKIDQYINDRFVNKAGIKQLLKVINTIETGGFDFDNIKEMDFFKNGQLVIQPMIVYSDLALDFDGLNYILNEYFKAELDKKTNKFLIKDIILIHLDHLIKYQDIYHNNQIKLSNLFPSYLSFIKRTSVPKDAKVDPQEFITFGQYFFKKLKTKNILPKLPEAFEEISELITSK